MNNSLFNDLRIIQNDYLSLLKDLDKIPQDEISIAKIDSINIFWYENRNIVNLLFEFLFRQKDTYCFSAATIFDVEDKDQNSFFMLGEYHVFDDPIPDYLNFLPVESDEIYFKKMKKIISNTIKDNIRIIEELSNDIIILPLRYSSVILNQHYDQLDEMAEMIFCNFFNNISSIEEYKTKVIEKEDLIKYLNPYNSSVILLFEGDNPSNTWDVRLQEYKENNNNFSWDKYTVGDVFFFSVYGHLRQSLALIDMVSTFKVIPFIRSFLPLHYFVLLSSLIEDNLTQKPEYEHENNWWKSQVSYFLYREFSKREFKYSLTELKQKAKDINFEKRLFDELGHTANKQEVKLIIRVVNKLLNEI